MPRICSVEPPKWAPPERKGETTLELDLRVVTPLFGGGYEPGETDDVTPIRAAAIRGHLRFWWRATAGARFTTSEELFAAEATLWGSAASERGGKRIGGPGSVRVVVTNGNPGVRKPLHELAPRSDPKRGPREGVFLFPFQEQGGSEPRPEAFGRTGVTFTLHVSCPGDALDVVRGAVRAWIAFGGVGARTRRGCGALAVDECRQDWLPPADASTRFRWLGSLLPPEAHSSLMQTTLAGAQLVLGDEASGPGRAWTQLGTFWCAVRKGHVGRKEYSPMSGGRWADYRGALLDYERRPQQSIKLAKPQFGLPMIYQKFPQSRKPADYAPTIEAGDTGRMASPVILKPLALANGTFVPLVAVLPSPRPRVLRIAGRKVELEAPTSDAVLIDMRTQDPLEVVLLHAEQELGSTRVRMEVLS